MTITRMMSPPPESMRSLPKIEKEGNVEYEKKDIICRDVNLIDISCRMHSCYGSQVQHRFPASFLCSSKDSLRCIFALAVIFKMLLHRAINAYDANNIDEDKLLRKVHVNGMNLGSLLPTPAHEKSGFLTKSVHMFNNLFVSRSSCTNLPVVNLDDAEGVDIVTVRVDNAGIRMGNNNDRKTRVILMD